MSDKALSLFRSRQIGFIFQFPSLIPSLTILENVLMPTVFTGKQDRTENRKNARRLLEMVGLNERTQVYPRQLSAGEQKRSVIARALINRPEIILADEPTSDLDEQTEHEIMKLLLEIRQPSVSFVIVTHSLQLLSYATRAFKMEEGNLHPIEKPSVNTENGSLYESAARRSS
jgi:ABC-type lipoprotein export system ATPase subunit